MFRNLAPALHDEAPLRRLAATMMRPPDARDAAPVSTPGREDERENRRIPAGYTYIGQFVTHDLTFDPASSFQRQNDPDALENFRTPRFDLDSLYGRGPNNQPYLYRSGPRAVPHPVLGFDQRGVMFLIGNDRSDPDDGQGAALAGFDLPRNSEGRALIGDPRNDENLIVSQLQLTFLKFHNRVVEHVYRKTGLEGDDLFTESQRLVRWHYQWMVLHDFLPRILGPAADESAGTSVLDDILRVDRDATSSGAEGVTVKSNLRFYSWRESPYIPVEFSVAAFRFGHAMVRPSYFINDFVKRQTNSARIPIFSRSDDQLANLSGFRPLPENWGVEWKYFFEMDPAEPPQYSFKICTSLGAPLADLSSAPGAPDLAQLDLLRGASMTLPSGQNVARAMGLEPISDPDLGLGDRGAPEFDGDAPLWFYVLREAELFGGSQWLGPVGGRICAEVLTGLMIGDPRCFLNIDPAWKPPLSSGSEFGMPDLIRFATGEEARRSFDEQSRKLGLWRRDFGGSDAAGASGSLWSA
ncbi:MAG: heme peroxidase family protein [Kiloniellales bacterium]|jgi:hypothetical protein